MFADPEIEDTLERQLTLGTASLLGIFFGLVLVCGIFFGFGYSFGRRSFAQSAALSAPLPAKPVVIAAPAQASALPPAPLSRTQADLPALQSAPNPAAEVVPEPLHTAAAMSLPAVSASVSTAGLKTVKAALKTPSATVSATEQAALIPQATPSEVLKQVLSKPSAIHPVMEETAASVPYARRAPLSPNALRSTSTPYIYTPPFYVHTHGISARHAVFPTSHDALATPHEVLTVQIAAMSRQDDAEVLASSLRKRGFVTSIHNDEPDSLFHVQVGPYQRNVAMAARQKLIANGYNAVLK